MAIKFRKADSTKVALKVLIFGESGSGKSTMALTFPKIVAIDTEDGLAHYTDNENLLYITNTTSFVETKSAIDEVKSELIDEVSTLLIDSETKIYENQQHSYLKLVERRARRKGQDVDDANLSLREWGKIKAQSKELKAKQIELSSLGVNVVSVCQLKEKKEQIGDRLVITEIRPDALRGIEYDFDIVVKTYTTRENESTKYFGEILKDRTGVYQRGQVLENPSFNHWKSVFEKNARFKESKRDFSHDVEKDYDEIADDVIKHEDAKTEFLSLFQASTKELQTKIAEEVEKNNVDINNVNHTKMILKLNEMMK